MPWTFRMLFDWYWIIIPKTPSPQKPTAKRFDLKHARENFRASDYRLSQRTRCRALDNSFGTSIPFNEIDDATSEVDKTICNILIPDIQLQLENTNAKTNNPQRDVGESSTDIECFEVNAKQDTPENFRTEGTTATSQAHKEITPLSNEKLSTVSRSISPEKSTRSTPPHFPSQIAIESRYVIDRPPTTTSSLGTNLARDFDAGKCYPYG